MHWSVRVGKVVGRAQELVQGGSVNSNDNLTMGFNTEIRLISIFQA